MLKKILMAFAMLCMLVGGAFAAVEVNSADQAALDSLKGVGAAKSKSIIDERSKNGPFKDWADFQKRVKGFADKSTDALSKNGMTINGQSKPGVEVAKAASAAASTAAAASAPSGKPAASLPPLTVAPAKANAASAPAAKPEASVAAPAASAPSASAAAKK